MARAREAVLRRDLARLLQDLAALEDRVSAQAAAIEAKDRDLDWLATQLAERDRLIANLRRSHSWRLTAPLRSLSWRLRTALGLRRPGPAPDPAPALAASALAAPAPATSAPATSALAPLPAPGAAFTPPPLPAGGPVMLILSDHLPLYDQQSGGLRLKTLIGLMGEVGLRMVHGSLFEPDCQPGILADPDSHARYRSVLHGLGVTDFLFGRDQIGAYLAANGAGLSFVFIVFPDTMEKMLPLVRRHCPAARVIYDMVDFHGLRMMREADLRQDPALREKAQHQIEVEIASARAADLTIAVTDDERAAMLRAAPDVVVEVLPNLFEVPVREFPPAAGRRDLLFVGGFWHQPNGDAMVWFADAVFPLIRQEFPTITLRIVGANAGNEVLALGARPGIELLGFVPDLEPLFDQHRVFVAPLRYGAGMKGKVGQSLIHALPVVATGIGAEGMGLVPGRHLLVADDPAEFAAEVIRLLQDDALWALLSAAGRAHIAATLSPDAVRGRIRALFGG